MVGNYGIARVTIGSTNEIIRSSETRTTHTLSLTGSAPEMQGAMKPKKQLTNFSIQRHKRDEAPQKMPGDDPV